MTYLILLLLLCLSWPGETVSSNMKGVWMPIQAVSGYPEWNDFASAEASAASQALMYAHELHVVFLCVSFSIVCVVQAGALRRD